MRALRIVWKRTVLPGILCPVAVCAWRWWRTSWGVLVWVCVGAAMMIALRAASFLMLAHVHRGEEGIEQPKHSLKLSRFGVPRRSRIQIVQLVVIRVQVEEEHV